MIRNSKINKSGMLGASLVEYVLIATTLVIVGVVVGQMLFTTAQTASDSAIRSYKAKNGMTPCPAPLISEECY